MTIEQYLENVSSKFNQGNATEHTFRGLLEQLIESIVPEVIATNEPKRQSCGAPDYILTKNGIPVGFIEAKDIGDKDLGGVNKAGNKEQFDRYKASLNNLIFTDYLDFHLFIDGVLITNIQIGKIENGVIKAIPGNFAEFSNLLKDFCSHIGQTIKSPKRLAEMMAGKARLLSDVIEKALTSDNNLHEDSSLKDQLTAFQQILIHDITPKGFADVYSQTIAYGMFAARLHDPTLPTFSRQEAAELIPKSNPFLRKLFGYIAGPDIDDRIKWIVDSLVDIFLACNVEEILKNYGKATKMEDPIIHFYETFLSEYDPKLRKARGVWYTPAPVVKFIVRAVDDILKSEFELPQGLGDTSKTKIKVDLQGKNIEQEVHKVQILDPATGTGTFLAETIKHIHQKFEGQQGIWSNYVESHLIPRLNGFELLMASYAMAHLKLDLLLTETGYTKTRDQRLRVYLTNSLEEYHQDTGSLFANWLSTEANEANHIKRDTPVMCVLGNPPYSVSSTNKNDWIENLISDYKKDLNEKNIQPLSDDYIKFIRFGQHFIDKNGSGILAYISNNSFIDGLIHRHMRRHLLESFDKIYIIDLHGNSNRKETSPDGGRDENVFDIQQGVSINIFIKNQTKKKDELGQVFHYDLFGKREHKYETLLNNSINSIKWDILQYSKPDFYFVKKDFNQLQSYKLGFKIGDLFISNITGIKTHDDENLVAFQSFSENNFKYDYRPFDCRYINYDLKKVVRARYSVMRNMLNENISLIVPRQAVTDNWNHIQVSKYLSDNRIQYSNKGIPIACPLYIYNDSNGQQTIGQTSERIPNLDAEIVNQISIKLGLKFTPEKEIQNNTFAPIDILDYIYAILHSPSYREKYKEFLKIDFPTVPYPKNENTFWKLVKLGGEIRQIHLLESPTVEKYITKYPIDGNNMVVKPKFENGKVYINDSQYFADVPQAAWEFYIGGYQPAQKWLKDRKDRKLEFDDILHYQKIIVALVETDRIMRQIDEVDF
jgi:predicted helicase